MPLDFIEFEGMTFGERNIWHRMINIILRILVLEVQDLVTRIQTLEEYQIVDIADWLINKCRRQK